MSGKRVKAINKLCEKRGKELGEALGLDHKAGNFTRRVSGFYSPNGEWNAVKDFDYDEQDRALELTAKLNGSGGEGLSPYHWIIGKEFALDYGHRVWTQKLLASHATDTGTACRHLHGHRGTCIVYLEANELDKQGMVTDFKHLGWFKKWLDDTLDHRFIVDVNDPLLPMLLPHFSKEYFTQENKHEWGYWETNIHEAPHQIGKVVPIPMSVWKELYDGFVVVDFVPTSENIAKWLNMIVTIKMAEIDVKVHSLQWYETPKSQTIYRVNNG